MWAPSRSNSSAFYIQAYLFKYFSKAYMNNLSMIDDDEDMPPLLSDMHFDDES